ncbi:hypothetical protein D918_09307 [Trichuris suis]|nr:hypothetical protein D918_09307 [Trichuris suis]
MVLNKQAEQRVRWLIESPLCRMLQNALQYIDCVRCRLHRIVDLPYMPIMASCGSIRLELDF